VSKNMANPSNVQWNIHTGAIPSAYIGRPMELGYGFNMESQASRATGNVFANNWVMNQLSTNSDQGGFLDQTQIRSVDGTGCGGQVRIGIWTGYKWNVGDSITISNTLPSGMNANGTFTVASTQDATSPGYVCLAGSSFGTGSWTPGTGVINGGVSWANNRTYNVNQPLYVLPTEATNTTSAGPSISGFTPLTTAGCPQASGCPSIEGYMASLGLPANLSDFVRLAKLNRKGSYDSRFTAAKANNYIRSRTDPSIALQPE
jgi:hypothetical protein